MGNILASEGTTLKTSINNTIARYGLTQSSVSIGAGTALTAATINDLRNKLEAANTNAKNTTSQNFATIPTVTAGATIILQSLLNTLTTYATNIYNGYCTCNCNRCTCNCDYCPCDCNYCPCNCNYCTCNCNRCACDSECSCNCNYCTCDCDRCGSCYCGSPVHGNPPYADCPSDSSTCLLSYHIVYTSKYPTVISNVEIGDYVLTKSGDYKQVIGVWKSTKKLEIVGIETQFSTNWLTKDHPVFWKNPEGELVNLTAGELYDTTRDMDVSESFVLFPIVNNKRFEQDSEGRVALADTMKIDKNLLLLSTFIILYGKLNDSENQIEFTVEDQNVLDTLNKLIYAYMGTNFEQSNNTTTMPIAMDRFFGGFTSAIIKEMFFKKGEKIIPSWYLNLPESMIQYFVECLKGYSGNEFILKGDMLIRQLRLLLLSNKYDMNIIQENGIYKVNAIASVKDEYSDDEYIYLPIKEIKLGESKEYDFCNLTIDGEDSFVSDFVVADKK